jgi:hypothetical protein
MNYQKINYDKLNSTLEYPFLLVNLKKLLISNRRSPLEGDPTIVHRSQTNRGLILPKLNKFRSSLRGSNFELVAMAGQPPKRPADCPGSQGEEGYEFLI